MKIEKRNPNSIDILMIIYYTGNTRSSSRSAAPATPAVTTTPNNPIQLSDLQSFLSGIPTPAGSEPPVQVKCLFLFVNWLYTKYIYIIYRSIQIIFMNKLSLKENKKKKKDFHQKLKKKQKKTDLNSYYWWKIFNSDKIERIHFFFAIFLLSSRKLSTVYLVFDW